MDCSPRATENFLSLILKLH